MRVLIGCEYSGVTRNAFRKLGHDAWSCDLLSSDDSSEFHIQGDVLNILNDGWDLAIFHPECTYLTNSGVRHLHTDAKRWVKLFDAADFFKKLMDADIPRIAIENPIMHKYAKRLIGKQQSQLVQPWMFGHMEQKATCLWLKGLPLLKETNNVKEAMMKLPDNERQRLLYLPPSKDRWKIRSRTFSGLGDAMASQWGAE